MQSLCSDFLTLEKMYRTVPRPPAYIRASSEHHTKGKVHKVHNSKSMHPLASKRKEKLVNGILVYIGSACDRLFPAMRIVFSQGLLTQSLAYSISQRSFSGCSPTVAGIVTRRMVYLGSVAVKHCPSAAVSASHDVSMMGINGAIDRLKTTRSFFTMVSLATERHVLGLNFFHCRVQDVGRYSKG